MASEPAMQLPTTWVVFMMKYIKQLDSLRATAVILVIISHWIPDKIPVNRLPNGRLGVDIFFVLSGFLISWILMESKKKAAQLQTGKATIFSSFYIRRALRIFPVYYVVLTILLFFHRFTNTSLGTSYPYYFTYASNFHMHSLGGWDGILSHFWSLAVEEQFYLIWPAVVLFVNDRYLPHAIMITILTGMISELAWLEDPYGLILTQTCLHSFAMGALLAWFVSYNNTKLERFYKVIRIPALISVLFLAAGLFRPAIYSHMFRTFSSVLALFVITHLILYGNTAKLKLPGFWNNRILIFLGKISYGLYLFHNLIPHFTYGFAEKMGVQISAYPYGLGFIAMTVINLIILTGISYVSFRLIESPMLELKKRFQYVRSNRKKKIPAEQNMLAD